MSWTTFKKIAKDCATEIDGESYCTFRVSACILTLLGVPAFIFMSIYSVVNDPSHHFDMLAFGSAFGGILSGEALLAGGVAFKAAKGESLPDKDNGEAK